jgi:hypothetical protein
MTEQRHTAFLQNAFAAFRSVIVSSVRVACISIAVIAPAQERQWLVFETDTGIYTVDDNGQQLKNLSGEGAQPFCSPRGGKIAFF